MGGIALLATAMQSLLHSRIGFRLPSGSVSLSDDEIIELACKRRSTGMKFQALWNGDWNSYFNSASEADSSIVFTLAYFTKDAAQIDRLFRRSQLMREKWDQKHGNESYGQRTIAKALSKVTKQYEPKKKRPASPKQGSQPPANLGFPKGAIDWDFKSDQTENAMAVEFIDGKTELLIYRRGSFAIIARRTRSRRSQTLRTIPELNVPSGERSSI
jgi:putative DNA primase/helicase